MYIVADELQDRLQNAVDSEQKTKVKLEASDEELKNLNSKIELLENEIKNKDSQLKFQLKLNDLLREENEKFVHICKLFCVNLFTI